MKNALASVLAAVLVTGTAFAGSNYNLKIDAPSARKAQKGEARISIQPQGAFHMNMEYPTKLTIKAPDGVTVEKTTQNARDAVKFEKGKAEFVVGFTAADTGKKSFTGELRFAVCTDDNCNPRTEKLAFDVDVK